MSCREIEALRDGYIDDDLSPDERLRVERHLAECAGCREMTGAVRALVNAASKLPRGIAPDRDLFPEIRERIERHDPRSSTRPTGPVARYARWIGLAASLVVVLIAGSLALRQEGDRSATGVAPAEEVLLAGGAAVDPCEEAIREYAQAAELLLDVIEERRDSFSPETLAVLDRNLALIDRAIEEVRAALAADPASRINAQVLTSMYEQKVELLRRVSRLST